MPGLGCCMGRYCVGSKDGTIVAFKGGSHFQKMIVEKYLDAMLSDSNLMM